MSIIRRWFKAAATISSRYSLTQVILRMFHNFTERSGVAALRASAAASWVARRFSAPTLKISHSSNAYMLLRSIYSDCPWVTLGYNRRYFIDLGEGPYLPPAVILCRLACCGGVGSTASVQLPLPDHFHTTGGPLRFRPVTKSANHPISS